MIPQRNKAKLEALLHDPRISNWDGGTNYPIRSHAAKGPLIIHCPEGKKYVSMDKKTKGYPNKHAIGKACGFGGNWHDVRQLCPEDLYLMEIMEELTIRAEDGKTVIRHPIADMIKEGVVSYSCFGEYFGVTPEKIHGNPNMGLYLNPVTWFVAHVQGKDLLDRLGVSSKVITKEKLHNAITAVAEFRSSALFDFDDLNARKFSSGDSLFAWGDDRLLTDVLKTNYDIDPRFVLCHMEMYRLTDVKQNAPYAERWTAKYDFLNPIRKGTTDDAYVFDADGRKPGQK